MESKIKSKIKNLISEREENRNKADKYVRRGDLIPDRLECGYERLSDRIRELEWVLSECESQDTKTSENSLNISDVSNQRRLLIAFADAWNSCDASLIEYDYVDMYLDSN